MTAEIKDISIEEYHSCDGISASGIKLLSKSAYEYWDKYENPTPNKLFKTSPSMEFGTMTHAYFLEHDSFYDRYYVSEKFRKGSSAYVAALLKSEGKRMVSEEEMEMLIQMKDMVSKHPAASKLLAKGDIEKSIFWIDQESDVLCKTRPDLFNNAFIVDIKTTSNFYNFIKSDFFPFKYYVQGAMQQDGIFSLIGKILPVIYLVISTKYPFVVDTYSPDQEVLQKGRLEYKEQLFKYKQCKETNHWPFYKNPIEIITLAA